MKLEGQFIDGTLWTKLDRSSRIIIALEKGRNYGEFTVKATVTDGLRDEIMNAVKNARGLSDLARAFGFSAIPLSDLLASLKVTET